MFSHFYLADVIFTKEICYNFSNEVLKYYMSSATHYLYSLKPTLVYIRYRFAFDYEY